MLRTFYDKLLYSKDSSEYEFYSGCTKLIKLTVVKYSNCSKFVLLDIVADLSPQMKFRKFYKGTSSNVFEFFCFEFFC